MIHLAYFSYVYVCCYVMQINYCYYYNCILVVVIFNNKPTFSGSCSGVTDTFALHAPLVVGARCADVGTLFRLCVADPSVSLPALHRVAQFLLQNRALHINAPFTPDTCSPDTSCSLSTCILCRRLHVSCIGDKTVVTATCMHLYPRVEQ